MNQQAFGALGGVSRNAQFTYESGKRSPDLAYFLNLAERGIDIGYLITGRRSVDTLTERTSSMLSDFDRLGSDWQNTILAVIRQAASSATLVEEAGRHSEHPTIQDRRLEYRAE